MLAKTQDNVSHWRGVMPFAQIRVTLGSKYDSERRLKNKPVRPEDWTALQFEVISLFSGAPVAEEELFAGRLTEVRRILEAAAEPSKHVLLYGERGVGKTSLSNIFWKRYNRSLQSLIAARVQADASDSFSSLWIKAMSELIVSARAVSKYDLTPISCDYAEVTPDIIRREFQLIRPNAVPILIIDEFDKLKDPAARELTAHVIKSLYDYNINITVILVGVAEDVSNLINDHASIRRALTQIKLERMNNQEINDLIDRRLTRTPLRISGDARWTIVTLSRGLPYFTQMLGKFAARSAIRDARLLIDTSDVEKAMELFIQEEEHTFKDQYRLATESNQADNLYPQALLSCALAKCDENGFFTATEVIQPFNSILNQKRRHAHFERHLREFLTEKRGHILERRGTRRQYRYRFTDPMMQPYVIIRGMQSKMLSKDAMDGLLQRQQLSLPITH